MTTMTATHAKAKFLNLLRRSQDAGEVYSITHNGQPCAVIMGHEEYEGFLETIEILRDKAFSQRLLKAVSEADRGDTVPFEEVVGRKQCK